jgi:hydroxypyruvate isomerase
MPKFGANLSMLFTEVDFMERFERAARAGLKAVEYMFPYPYDARRIAETLKACNLKQVLFNLPAGKWETGERAPSKAPSRSWLAV